jgi:putative transcriptional regulator
MLYPLLVIVRGSLFLILGSLCQLFISNSKNTIYFYKTYYLKQKFLPLMLSSIPAAAGRLLISEPFMLDPNFKRSVILLTEYSDDGAMGFILNQPSEFLIGDLLPEIPYSEMPVFIGGPVANNTLHFIHCCPAKIDGGIEIGGGVYWGGDFEEVKALITSYRLKVDEIRFFTGYSGWTSKQLDAEIKEDSWIVADKLSKEIIFTKNEDNLWREVVIGLGQRYAHIANFPENPELN